LNGPTLLTIWLNRMVKKTKDETTESRILFAAQKVFLKKGMDGARMQDIADEAGINKALLHYYFRSKEKLFETIFTEVANTFLPKLASILGSDESVFAKIELFCKEYISQIIETPYVPIFVLNEINKQPKAFLDKILKGRQLPISVFVKQLEKEVKLGKIKPIQPLQLLLNILSLCLFPFVARPMLQHVSGLSTTQFNQMMEKRKTEIPQLIIESIKK
jgi:TetR/AcrR family transcriptional regulator